MEGVSGQVKTMGSRKRSRWSSQDQGPGILMFAGQPGPVTWPLQSVAVAVAVVVVVCPGAGVLYAEVSGNPDIINKNNVRRKYRKDKRRTYGRRKEGRRKKRGEGWEDKRIRGRDEGKRAR
ncbi:hypothetical protein BDW71DRAFT_142399 [Aspergillus fruticulosus]